MKDLIIDRNTLLEVLKMRFEQHMERHPGVSWSEVADRLVKYPSAVQSLQEMERTGGEPDVVGLDQQSGEYLFFDCSAESPLGRRSLCYDPEALTSRKENKPTGSAVGMASAMGIELLSEEQYAYLQSFGAFDLKTSSWLLTGSSVRDLGGAVFGDKRYDRVFVYHNGAESYYASRGFRGLLRV